MFAYDAGSLPVQCRKAFAFGARLAIGVAVVALAGCASEQYQSPKFANRSNVAVAQTVIDLEDDGLPAQTPPARGTRYAPDDPTEPFSRNYGGVNPSATGIPAAPQIEHKKANTPDIPNDLPPAFRQKLVTAMSAEDE